MMRGIFLGAMLAVGGAVLAAGCGGSSGNGKPSGKDVAKEESGHGWWCDEHGVKEEECSMCSPTVARKFKDKGD
jgi:hypothetical protein